jgi:hypothetical protein
MRLDLRNRTQACVSAAQIVVGIVDRRKPAHSAGLRRRGKLPPQKNSLENSQLNDFAVALSATGARSQQLPLLKKKKKLLYFLCIKRKVFWCIKSIVLSERPCVIYSAFECSLLG